MFLCALTAIFLIRTYFPDPVGRPSTPEIPTSPFTRTGRLTSVTPAPEAITARSWKQKAEDIFIGFCFNGLLELGLGLGMGVRVRIEHEI